MTLYSNIIHAWDWKMTLYSNIACLGLENDFIF